MTPHLLINFERQKYYENEPKFNGVYSRNNLFGLLIIGLLYMLMLIM